MIAATADAAALHLRLIVTKTAAEAEAIRTELSAGGSFARLARERSVDPSSAHWGELDPAEAATLKKQLSKEVGALREGGITGVIRLGSSRFALIQRIDLAPYRAGAQAFRAKNFGEAEKNLLLHLQSNPDAIKARIMLGEIYEQRHMPGKARPEYEEALKLDPGNRDALARFAALQREEAGTVKADAPQAGQAGSGKPPAGKKDASPAETRGSAESKVIPSPEPMPAAGEKTLPDRLPLRMIVVGSAAEAAGILDEYRRGKPFFFLADDRSGDRKSRLTHGDLGEVETASLQPELREELARLLPGKVSGPIKLNEHSYALIQIKNTAHLKEVRKALSAGRLKDAQEHLIQHLSLNPDDLSSWMQLALLYEKTNATDRAEAAYRQALIFHPAAAEPYERLGELMLSKKECIAARETLKTGAREAGASPILEKLSEIAEICLIGTGK